MNVLLANLVLVLHILFVAFVVAAPFTGNEELITLHVLVLPFVCFHWLMANDSCFLTLVEQRLRGVNTNQSFFHSLMSPLYKPSGFTDPVIRKTTWVITLLLWAYSLRELKKRRFRFVKEIIGSLTATMSRGITIA